MKALTWALTLALALTPVLALTLPRRRASKRNGGSVVESVGTDLPSVPLRATAPDSTQYALFGPHDPPETHQRFGSIGRSVWPSEWPTSR